MSYFQTQEERRKIKSEKNGQLIQHLKTDFPIAIQSTIIMDSWRSPPSLTYLIIEI
jgi:hypothetical protein